MAKSQSRIATSQYTIGDSILFSGFENILHFDQVTGNLINVYFNLGQKNSQFTCGIILDVKEEPGYGGELEIYSNGDILTLPWEPGHKPDLIIIGEKQ